MKGSGKKNNNNQLHMYEEELCEINLLLFSGRALQVLPQSSLQQVFEKNELVTHTVFWCLQYCTFLARKPDNEIKKIIFLSFWCSLIFF